jgi:hypothetical protein
MQATHDALTAQEEAAGVKARAAIQAQRDFLAEEKQHTHDAKSAMIDAEMQEAKRQTIFEDEEANVDEKVNILHAAEEKLAQFETVLEESRAAVPVAVVKLSDDKQRVREAELRHQAKVDAHQETMDHMEAAKKVMHSFGSEGMIIAAKMVEMKEEVDKLKHGLFHLTMEQQKAVGVRSTAQSHFWSLEVQNNKNEGALAKAHIEDAYVTKLLASVKGEEERLRLLSSATLSASERSRAKATRLKHEAQEYARASARPHEDLLLEKHPIIQSSIPSVDEIAAISSVGNTEVTELGISGSSDYM